MSLSPSELFFAGKPSGGGGGGGYQISRSIRFDSVTSGYLSRTLPSSGNTRTFTLSTWVKRSSIGLTGQALLAAGTSTPNHQSYISIDVDALYVVHYDGTTIQCAVKSADLFRDTAAWMHVVVVIDTTQATASNRVKFYVNNRQITNFSSTTYPPLNQTFFINDSSYLQSIGSMAGYAIGQYAFDGYLADTYLINGQALTPSSFAETDATTGAWNPKAYSGSYGTTGWHLDYSNNASASALGTDSSGNGNNWTVNNITVAQTSYGVTFDGASDQITVADNIALRPELSDFTLEFWVYYYAHTGYQTVFTKGYSSAGGMLLQTGNNNGTFAVYLNSATLFTASSGTPILTWNHYALVRSGNTVTLYRNGNSVGSGSFTASLSDTSAYEIGGSAGGGGYWTNGIISNFRFVKGTAVYTSTFTPPTSPLTAISGTQLLTCQSPTFVDNSSNAFTVTPAGQAAIVGLNPFGNPATSDSLIDSPTNGTQTDTGLGGQVVGNYCTWNPVASESVVTLTNGNLEFSQSGAGGGSATFAISSGKWFWEVVAGTGNTGLGIVKANTAVTTYLGGFAGSGGWFQSGTIYLNYTGASVAGATPSSYTAGDLIGLALDMDAGTLKFYKNGVLQNQYITGLSGTVCPAFGTNVAVTTSITNFGQRQWAYTSNASGYKALCTANLPAPAIIKSNTAMDVVLYSGTGTTSGNTQTISSLAFSPDLIWIKSRSNAINHALFDTVRGVNKTLIPNSNVPEEATNIYGAVSAFNSNGFTLTYGSTDGNRTTQNGYTYAAWVWDGGSTTVTNNDGTLSSQVRVNPTAGISIATASYFAGTVGHGLGVAPAMVIIKQKDATNGWYVYHKDLNMGAGANSSYIQLDATAAGVNYGSNLWNVTSTTIMTNQSLSGPGLFYSFAAVPGFSSFGTYTGNGSSTYGPFIYTNFRPRYVLIRSTAASRDWIVKDALRASEYNPQSGNLYANQSLAEDTTSTVYIDFLSNGFKIRGTNSSINASAETFIYAAFAEAPFSLARAR